MEDRRRRRHDDCGRGPDPRRADAGGDKAGRRGAGRSGEHSLRGRGRDRVPAPRAGLEAEYAQGQPRLSEEPDPAAFRGPEHRGDRPARGAQLVRLPGRDPGGGRPLDAGAFRHHARSGTDGVSPRGFQPVPGHPAIPPQGPRALPVRRGDTETVREAVGARRPPAGAGRRRSFASAYRMPEGGDRYAPMVGLSRGPSLSSRFEDRPPHRLAVGAGAGDPRRAGPDRPLGLSGAERPRSAKPELAGLFLAAGSRRGGYRRRPASRSPPHACQHRAETGRDGFSPSAGCSATPIPRQPSNTPTRPTPWSWRRPKRSVACWRVRSWRERNV